MFRYQRTLYQNLNYLTQFDPNASYYSNNLPPPDAFNQIQSSVMNGNAIQQNQSDSIYRTQTITATSVDTNMNLQTSSSHLPNKSSLSQQQQQQYSYGQYPMYHQQNLSSQSNSQQVLPNNYDERQQFYHPQQNYLMQQQWQNTSRISSQQYPSGYQQQLPP
ncbi:hypothetical protein I4U23_029980 [Adineta vaga]|nr:hypothetical protein I4U23_029980 [Adineta vaga]